MATIGFAIAMPEASFISAWPALFGFLAVGYWFYSINDDLESFSAGPLVALVLAAVVAIALILPNFVASSMAAEANDWFLPIAVLVLLLGILVPQFRVITRPKKWWLPKAAWIPAAVLLVAAFVV